MKFTAQNSSLRESTAYFHLLRKRLYRYDKRPTRISRVANYATNRTSRPRRNLGD